MVAAGRQNRALRAHDRPQRRCHGIARPGGPRPLRREPGPDTAGNVVALYSRCDSHGKHCDAYRYAITKGGNEHRLSISSPRYDEAWPSQWRGTFAFVRRGSAGKHPVIACDVPFARRAGAKSSRRLDRGHCASVTGQVLRGSIIAQTTLSTSGIKSSQVRRLSVNGGRSRLLAYRNFGEETNILGSPSISGKFVYVTRTGVNPSPSFVRIDVSTAARREVRAVANLEGPMARDGGVTTYLELEGGFRGGSCAVQSPCRVVQTTADPLGSAERTLAPKLVLDAPAPGGKVLADRPLTLTGSLTRAAVKEGAVVRTQPVAGRTLEILRGGFTVDPTAQQVAPTGRTATTAPDGSFSVAMPAPQPSFAVYQAVTRQETVPSASATVAVNAAADVALDVSATSVPSGTPVTFSGTIAPAQPGREIKIQRLTNRKCQTATNGGQVCNDTWATLGSATLAPDGSSYAATLPVTASGIYTAVLPFVKFDEPGGATAYSGRSRELTITVTG